MDFMTIGPLRILIIEPNRAVRSALAGMLHAAETGFDAFEASGRAFGRSDFERADCVLLAEELASDINPTDHDVPFILLTSGSTPNDPRFLDHIFRDSCTPSALERKIHRAIEVYGLRRGGDVDKLLRHSEELFRTLARAAPVGIFRTDRDGRCVYVNDRWCDFAGMKLNEALGDGWVAAIHPDDRARVFDEWQRSARLNEPFELEYRLMDGDGRVTWVFGQSVAELDAEGKPFAFVGTITDITNRHEADKQLRFQGLLLDAVQQAVIATDLEGRITYWNRFAEQLYGWRSDEVLGRNIIGITTPTDGIIVEEASSIMDEMSRGNRWSGEFTLQKRDGSRFLGYVTNSPVTDDNGALIGIVGISHDITDEKASQERFRLALDAAAALVYDADLTGRRPTVAYGLERVTGFRNEDSDLSSEWWHSLIHPDDLPGHQEIYRQHLETGGTSRTVYRVRHKNGHWIWVEDTAQVVTDRDGQAIQLVGAIVDITARRESEEQIRESEERFRLATDSAGMFVWECDVATGRMKWSENAMRVLGYPIENDAMTVIDILDFIVPEDRERLRNAFLGSIKRDNPGFMIEFRGRSGRWWQAKGTVIRDSSGRALRVVAVLHDITERRRAEVEIETANYRFRVAEEAAKGFSYEWDVASGIVTRSKSIEHVLGYAPDELEPSWAAWRDLVHDADATVNTEEESLARLEALGDQSFIGEYRVRHKNGEYRWLMERGILVRDEHDRPQRVIGQTMDVTARREAEEKLLEAERRAVRDYRKLLSRIAPLAQTLGMARELTAIYRALLGFIGQEMPCEGFFVSFYDAENQLKNVRYVWCEGHEPQIAAVRSIPLTGGTGANSRAIATGKTIITTREIDRIEGEFQILSEKNPEKPVESVVTPMIVMGRVIGTIEVQNHGRSYVQEHVVALEMAANLAAAAIENVRLMDIEARARSAAEEANRAKDEFLAVLSHELRTPLNSIKGWISMLQHHDLDEEQRSRAIEVIARNVNSQNALIEDILDVSRIISGKMKLESERLSFVSVVMNVVDAMRPIAEKNGVRLTHEIDQHADEMTGDTFRLQQIVSNLLNNAIKFTPFEGEVNVRLVRSGDFARLTVTDTGIGIPEELLGSIFERFQQADRSTRRRYSGLGLGLAIVRNLAELHGGSVSATSDGTGKGATFTVEIPLIPQAAIDFDESLHLEQARPGSDDGELAGMRLLVVDDDADTLEMMRVALETYGARVVLCLSADRAIEQLSNGAFDLLISDVGMAGMDGCDLVRHIRGELAMDAEKLPAVALSGYVSVEDRARAEAAGFQSHIGKPVNFDTLRETICELASNRNAEAPRREDAK